MIKEDIRKAFLEAGASAVGFARAGDVEPSELRSFEGWIGEGCHAGMDYLQRHVPLRSHPRHVLESAETVVSLAFSYTPAATRDESLPTVSAYALGKDYHDVIRKRLQKAIDTLKATYGGEWRICIDSAPLSERYWAMKAGIGRLGRNGSVIVEGCGTWCFLAEVLVSIPMEPDKPSERKCLSCGACVKVCPTGALRNDGTIDSRRCLSYLTIEHRGPWEGEMADVMASEAGKHTLFGCDRCLKVCPHNLSATPSEIEEFRASGDMLSLTAGEAAEMTQGRFSEVFRGSAVKRAKLAGFLRNARNCLPVVVAVLITLVLSACGTKRNTPVSRNWQAFTTRYNVYFNGEEHFKEQLKTMEETYDDDFTRLLLIHPAEARADAKRPQPTGNFRRTIEKMQKAIQLHSITRKPRKRASTPEAKAFRARDEFNPFLHNAWMRMAEAQYLDGDFLNAASTFLYISRHFTWLPEVVTEARIRQALCYCALNWTYEAENVLHNVKEKDLTSKSLRHLFALASADCRLLAGKYAEAIPFVKEGAETASGIMKHRLLFLLGQLYAMTGEKHLAFEAFKEAGSGASTPYRLKFNSRIKQSEVFEGSDVGREVGSLLRMTRYERNREYLDQIYYAVGNLRLSRGDTLEAIRDYRQAINSSTRNGIDKALAQLALGNILFGRHEYTEAQPLYSEAIPLLPDNYPGYRGLLLRSDVLDRLAVYAGNVHLQDSLLALSRLTPVERRAVCQKIVDDLLQREREAREAAEREAEMARRGETFDDPMAAATPAVPVITPGTDNSWYFYNRATRDAGKAEFQRRWGARRLEDDWRRRDKSSFSLSSDDEDVADDSLSEEDDDSRGEAYKAADATSDPHDVEYYLRQIPSTAAEIRTANDIIMEGLYNMALILKDDLADYPAATREFTRLLSRYPDNIYRLDTYYNLYLMAVREDNRPEAERWRAMILSDFPESPYGLALRDPAYFDNLRHMHEVQEGLYDEAYKAYLDNDNPRVHELTERMQRDFPLSPILPKFVFINSLSYLTEGDAARFREGLETLLARWPDTDMTPMAAGMLKGLAQGRQPGASGENVRGLFWDTPLAASDSIADGDSIPGFTLDPDSPQYLVLAYPKESVNANLLLYDVARFNFSTFVVKDFELEPMSFSNIGLLVVKGFANEKEVERYRTMLENSDMKLPEEVRPVIISKSDFELLLHRGRSFEEYFRSRENAQSELMMQNLNS